MPVSIIWRQRGGAQFVFCFLREFAEIFDCVFKNCRVFSSKIAEYFQWYFEILLKIKWLQDISLRRLIIADRCYQSQFKSRFVQLS